MEWIRILMVIGGTAAVSLATLLPILWIRRSFYKAIPESRPTEPSFREVSLSRPMQLRDYASFQEFWWKKKS